MKRALALALVCAAVDASLAFAGAGTEVGLDLAVVNNGDPVFVDQFDTGTLETPPWVVLTGTPGPESGSALAMRGGDFIALPVTLNPTVDSAIVAALNLTSFPAGSAASLVLFGDQPGELVTLTAAPGAVTLDEGGTPLANAGLPPLGAVALGLILEANGSLIAGVNDQILFHGPVAFGPITAMGVAVVPEPATLALAGLVVTVALARRRRAA
ncbi:MAG: PEP-CTERM sorting domain-containing protein [Planctomycetes bacterium]|nr:PEP-CTERM sorting domain-containing protein [Planctomycetota bacterium]